MNCRKLVILSVATLAVAVSHAAAEVAFRAGLSTDAGVATLVGYAPDLKVKAPAFLLLAEEDPAGFRDGTSGPSGCQWPVKTILANGYAALAIDCSKLTGDYFVARTAAVRAAMDYLEKGSVVDVSRVAAIGQCRLGEAAAKAAAADRRVAFAFANNPKRTKPQKGNRRTRDAWDEETAFDFAACGAKVVIGYEMSGARVRDFAASPAKFTRQGGTQLTGYDWLEYIAYLDREGWRVDLSTARKPRTFRVMAWNMEGQSEGPVEVDSLAKVVRDSQADVVLIVENYGILPRLAEKLGAGWQAHAYSMSLAILSKWTIKSVESPFMAPWNYLDASGPFNLGFAEIDVEGQPVRCCPLWIDWEPSSNDAPYAEGLAAVEKFMVSYPRFSNRRIDEVKGILASLRAHLTETDEIPMIIGGDFNGDSDLDWTEREKDVKGHFGLAVKWPEHILMREAGFCDTFRTLNPDPLKDYGCSWASTKSWGADGTSSHRPERIDFIYSKGPKLRPVASEMFIANYHRPFTWHGKDYASFPSDHGFALTTFELDTPAPEPVVTVTKGANAVVRNIPYKPAVTNCVLDLVHPTGVKGYPTVVWFHGGGLTSGRRHFIDIDTNRIAVATVEYRLMKTEKGKAIPNGPISPADVLDDCAAAAAWVQRHIGEYGGDRSKVFISGHSAGGYITYMLGLDKQWLGAYGLTPNNFAGYAPLSGQATKHFAVRQYFGQDKDQLNPILDAWAPISHAAKTTPPFCLMLGDARIEWKMRVQETVYFYEIFKTLGNGKVEYHSFPNTDHGSCYGPAMGYLTRFVDRLSTSAK